MNNMDLKPNSHKYKEKQAAALEKKKIEKVVKGSAKTRKNGVRKFTQTFISEDAKNIKSYVLNDVILAAAEVYYLAEDDFKFQMLNALKHLVAAKVMYKKLDE